MLDGRLRRKKGDKLKKQSLLKFLLIGVLIVNTIYFISNNFNRYLLNTSEHFSPMYFFFSLILKSIPCICLILLYYFITNNHDMKFLCKIRVFFLIYVILDLLSGFSYFIINTVQIKYVFFPFYSYAWMFYIIYAFKYLQYDLFFPFFLNTIVWVCYILQFKVINGKIVQADKYIEGKELMPNNKIVSVSFIIGIINSIFFLISCVLSVINLLKPELYNLGFSVIQVIIFAILLSFFSPSCLVFVLSIIGLILGRKEKVGKLINKISLIISVLMLLSFIIYMNIQA